MKSKIIGISTIALAASFSGNSYADVTNKTLTKDQIKLVESIVRDIIKKEPDLIGDALNKYIAQQKEAEKKKAQQAIVDNKSALTSDPTSPVIGNKNGDVTLVEFFDYNCPYCRRFHQTLKKAIEKDTDLRVVLKPYPILGPDSIKVMQAALAARSQGKYEELHTALMESDGKLTDEKVYEIAKSLKLDVKKMKEEAKSKDVLLSVEKAFLLGRALKVGGVPAIIIGDHMLSEAPVLDKIQFLVSEARQKGEDDSEKEKK